MRKRRIPKYSLHKATGQARVCIDGVDHYLGKFDSPESKSRYRQLIEKWLLRTSGHNYGSMTVGQLVLLYDDHIRGYYVKNGEPTSEVLCIKCALRPLVRLFSETAVCEFGPQKLMAVRKEMIDAGRERKSINRNVGRITRMFRWAVANEFCAPETVTALEAVDGLRAGRSDAVEAEAVEPAPLEYVKAVQPYVTRPVWGMVRFQLATAARPGEAVIARGCDITMAGDVWEFVPQSHKTEHHGRGRTILIGPRGQVVIREFLKMDLEAYLFSPRDADTRRTRARNGPGERYRRDSYTTALRRACVQAGVPVWTPNQLRHTAATAIRAAADLDTARAVLGHSNMKMTEVYAERDLESARRIIRKIG